jgi:hypothetical protein
MSDDAPQSFIAYWDAVDAGMKRIAGLDTFDAGTGAGPISSAYENGWTPEEFSLWWAGKHGLVPAFTQGGRQ